MDAATQLITSSTTAHISAIFLLLAVISYNYYVVHTQKVFILLAQRLRKVMPYYHGINFAIAYTGAVLSGFTHDLSPTVILMIPTTLFLMITEIKRYKKIRVIQLKEIEKQEEFKKFAKKIYMMQVMAIAFMYMIANIF